MLENICYVSMELPVVNNLLFVVLHILKRQKRYPVT